MAVKSSGSISILNDIVAEFGGTAPHSMSEYYGGAGLVPAGANPSVPASGQIKFSNMYGSVRATVLTYASNTSNVDLSADVVSAGGDLNTPVLVTINSGVTISGSPAMKTGTGWGNTTINITNNGTLAGSAGVSDSTSGDQTGTGGKGGYCYGLDPQQGQSGTSGSASAEAVNNGGSAFEHSQSGSDLSVIFDVAGTRTAGAGGVRTALGGGGGGGHGGNAYNNYVVVYGAGGGGAGSPVGAGGNNSNCGVGGNGASGNATTGGNGGDSRAGDGGDLGQAGEQGGGGFSGNRNPGSGGGSSTASGSAGTVLSGNTAQIS